MLPVADGWMLGMVLAIVPLNESSDTEAGTAMLGDVGSTGEQAVDLCIK